MWRPVVVLALLPAVAWAQEEDDDPGFARRKAPPAPAPADSVDEEPTPDPVPFTEEDPGLADQAIVRVTPRRPRAARPRDVELGWRIHYRTLTNKEIVDSSGETYTEDRFHVVGADVYPISGPIRIGLSIQGGMEMDDHDRFATVGIMLGLQQRRRAATPWLEGGIHVGPARRDFWYVDQPQPEPELTFLWAFSVEVGVDARIGRAGPIASIALGLQRTSYYSTRGNPDDPLFPVNDGSVTLKVGIGY